MRGTPGWGLVVRGGGVTVVAFAACALPVARSARLRSLSPPAFSRPRVCACPANTRAHNATTARDIRLLSSVCASKVLPLVFSSSFLRPALFTRHTGVHGSPRQPVFTLRQLASSTSDKVGKEFRIHRLLYLFPCTNSCYAREQPMCEVFGIPFV